MMVPPGQQWRKMGTTEQTEQTATTEQMAPMERTVFLSFGREI